MARKPPAERKTYKNEVNKFFTIKKLRRLLLQKNSNSILFRLEYVRP